MADGAVVFAMANPDPEVDPVEAAQHAAVVATGRSDFANQINNVLAFPGVFRGLLDAQSPHHRHRACCWPPPQALAAVVADDELNAAYIVPSVFHPDVTKVVAGAVERAACAAAGQPPPPDRRPPARRGRAPGPPRLAPGALPAFGPARVLVVGSRQNGAMSGLTGRLLVATPLLTDDNFRRAVVLLLDHGDDGALGVVVNRPLEVEVAAVLPAWQPYADRARAVLFQGGPVALDSALGLVAVPGDDDEPLGVRRIIGSLGLVDLDTPPEVVAAERRRAADLRRVRRAGARASWRSEIAEGSWYVVDAEARDAFSDEPDELWRQVLRRQRGDLAMVSTYPEDPTLN